MVALKWGTSMYVPGTRKLSDLFGNFATTSRRATVNLPAVSASTACCIEAVPSRPGRRKPSTALPKNHSSDRTGRPPFQRSIGSFWRNRGKAGGGDQLYAGPKKKNMGSKKQMRAYTDVAAFGGGVAEGAEPRPNRHSFRQVIRRRHLNELCVGGKYNIGEAGAGFGGRLHPEAACYALFAQLQEKVHPVQPLPSWIQIEGCKDAGQSRAPTTPPPGQKMLHNGT